MKIDRELIGSDRFIGMSYKAQALYLHLIVNADKNGIINNLHAMLRSLDMDYDLFTELEMNRFASHTLDGVKINTSLKEVLKNG